MKKTKQSVFFLFITLAALFCSLQSFAAGENSSGLYGKTIILQLDNKVASVNGSPIELDSPATTVKSRTMVPVAFISQSLGANVGWDRYTQSVTITYASNINIKLKLNNRYASINGINVVLDSPATTVGSRTMVPAAFIAKCFGADVEWVKSTRTVIIRTPEAIAFPDASLESLIRDKIGKPSGLILSSDVKEIKVLNASGKDISSIEGLQYFTGTTSLDLSGNKISDLGPLKALTHIDTLNLEENSICDISPLASLTQLKQLQLNLNNINSISALKTMSHLNLLGLAYNQITDIKDLQDLTDLSCLILYNNPILDISALKKLPNLQTLNLIHIQTSDPINADLFVEYSGMIKNADDIVQSTIMPGMTDYEKELALHDYIVTHTSYDYENYKNNTVPDESHTPYGVLVKGTGVCDGYARTMQILLNMAGIESLVVSGELADQDNNATGLIADRMTDNKAINLNHAWNLVKIDRKYYHLDTTLDDPVSKDGEKILQHLYFNISDSQIASDHNWDRSKYPPCTDNNELLSSTYNENKTTIFSENWIYTVINQSLYKLKTDGSKKIKLIDGKDRKVDDIYLENGWIFFIDPGDSKRICKIKTDGTGLTGLSIQDVLDICVYNGFIYYLKDKTIYKVTTEGQSNINITTDNIVTWMYIADNTLYFKAFNWALGTRVYKMALNSNNKTPLCNDNLAGFVLSPDGQSISFTYAPSQCIIKGWFYYINASDGNKIYRITTDGTSRTKITEDAVSDTFIEILGDWVYYKNTNDNKYSRIKTDGASRQAIE